MSTSTRWPSTNIPLYESLSIAIQLPRSKRSKQVRTGDRGCATRNVGTKITLANHVAARGEALLRPIDRTVSTGGWGRLIGSNYAARGQ